jgi:uncharacterized surface protein with fasciclin (FAS1) repeats
MVEKVATVQGQEVAIKVDMGNVYLNEDVQVIITDIETSNGVIHVIDTVLLPPAEAHRHRRHRRSGWSLHHPGCCPGRG